MTNKKNFGQITMKMANGKYFQPNNHENRQKSQTANQPETRPNLLAKF